MIYNNWNYLIFSIISSSLFNIPYRKCFLFRGYAMYPSDLSYLISLVICYNLSRIRINLYMSYGRNLIDLINSNHFYKWKWINTKCIFRPYPFPSFHGRFIVSYWSKSYRKLIFPILYYFWGTLFSDYY